jgi:hypothetical protein
MELNKIEKLLEKYFAAATTIEEEKELKDYFASSNVAPILDQYKPMFVYAVQTKQEQFTATLSLKTKKRSYAVWLSVAASVIVLLGVAQFTFNQYNKPQWQDLGTINDPEIAFKETQKALDMISEHVNKGLGSIKYINEYEQTKNKIFK